MPFDAAYLFSGVILTCDRVLQEKDGTISAIRLFDLLRVPQLPIQVEVRAVILLKATAPSGHHLFEMSAEHPDGSVKKVTAIDDPLYIDFASKTALGSKPGAQIVMELGIAVPAEGTYILRALIDGVEAARTSITLQLQPSPQSGGPR